MRKPELLSPAGDFERLEYALAYGADACYLAGKDFGMRTAPGNFTGEELEKACKLAHSLGKRVYVTVNTMPRSEEAAIIADLGVLEMCKQYAPRLERHISTQANITNYQAAEAWHKLGAHRVVMARELSLQEVALIREKTPPELAIEVFVHGAMCMSYSGRCYLSAYLTGRDGNRGACAQPCRWQYSLVERQRPGQVMDVFEGEEGAYILNSKDLCMLDHIPELIEAGVDSFKIEGRAKTAYYTAITANAYRRAIDLYCENPVGYGRRWRKSATGNITPVSILETRTASGRKMAATSGPGRSALCLWESRGPMGRCSFRKTAFPWGMSWSSSTLLGRPRPSG